MVSLYERIYNREDLIKRAGSMDQVGGVKLLELSDASNPTITVAKTENVMKKSEEIGLNGTLSEKAKQSASVTYCAQRLFEILDYVLGCLYPNRHADESVGDPKSLSVFL